MGEMNFPPTLESGKRNKTVNDDENRQVLKGLVGGCRFIEFDDFDNLFRNGKTAPPMER